LIIQTQCDPFFSFVLLLTNTKSWFFFSKLSSPVGSSVKQLVTCHLSVFVAIWNENQKVGSQVICSYMLCGHEEFPTDSESAPFSTVKQEYYYLPWNGVFDKMFQCLRSHSGRRAFCLSGIISWPINKMLL
jgi:hypothetical protein